MNRNNKFPFFSIIINCYNGEAFLNEAIKSVYNQSFTDWEIIFFDNASTDESSKIAKSFDKRIKYYYNDNLIPLGSARNRAIKKANGKYLAFLDCDDTWEPTKLLKQKKALETSVSDRGYAFCYTDAMRINHVGRNIMPFSQERENKNGDVFLSLMGDCFISMSSCVLDRKICLKLGGFDEALQYVEEWQLWLKVSQQYDLAYVPERLTNIRFHSGNTSKDYQGQSLEVMSMLQKIKVKPYQLKKKRTFMNMFQIRFLIIHTAHCFKNNFLQGLMSSLSLLWLCLSHPKISLELFKKYLSLKLLKFFYTKYFKNN